MSETGAWWGRRSVWLWVFGISTVIWVAVFVWLAAFRPVSLSPSPGPTATPSRPGPGLEVTPTPEADYRPANAGAVDAATLTAAGAFVTSVGSLVAIVLSHVKGQRELELERQMREKEFELERAKLELERMKVEAQRKQDSG